MKWLVTLKKKNENKYLVIDDVDENKEVSKKYEEVCKGVKKEIEKINGGKKIEYGKDQFYWFIWWSNDKLEEGIHKPVQFGVVMEIRWKLHCQVVATHILT